MPKINVYLPDDLAEAVRSSGVPVSTVCQRALEAAVRDVRSVQVAPGVTTNLERFTARARNAVALAGAAAGDDGVDLGSEHVVLGLIAEGEGIAAKALAALGVTDEAFAANVDQRSSTGDGNAVYLKALQEALKLGHNYIGTEHLLLGVAETLCTARDALSDLGVTGSSIRAQVIAQLTSIGVPAPVDANSKLDDILKRLENLEQKLA